MCVQDGRQFLLGFNDFYSYVLHAFLYECDCMRGNLLNELITYVNSIYVICNMNL